MVQARLLLGLIAAAPFQAAPVYIGSRTCARCHTGIAERQGRTLHAAALRPAAALPAAIPRPAGAEWAFGSGAQAITFVSQRDEDSYQEHALSFYTQPQALDATPGHQAAQEGMIYRTFAPDAAILRCFRCHSTGELALGRRLQIEPGEPGVRCEACHGPGSDHAVHPTAANIANPKRMTAAALNDLCGECHRKPPAAGAGTNWNNPWNTRHQPLYLSQSRCFLESKGRLSCLTCHNPHDDRPVGGDDRCVACHPTVRHTTATQNQRCMECHAPAVFPGPHLRFTNHWIGVYQLPLTGANRLRPRAQRPR